MRKRVVFGMLTAAILVLCCGCPQVREDAVITMGKQVMFKIIDKAKIDQSNMSASGRILNPKYEYEWFGGVGPYSKGSVQVIGVEVSASASSSGIGEGAPDQDLREKLYQISERKDIAKIERNAKITDAVLDYVQSKSANGILKRQVTDIQASNRTVEEKNQLIVDAVNAYIRKEDTKQLEEAVEPEPTVTPPK